MNVHTYTIHIRKFKLSTMHTWQLANFWQSIIQSLKHQFPAIYMHIYTVFEKIFILHAIRAQSPLIGDGYDRQFL